MSHWYLPTGEAFHFQENGKPVTLRQARPVNAAPSVTTILGILDKPALTNWKLKQVTTACWQHDAPELLAKDPDAYHKIIISEAFQQSTDQRDRGSEIHDCIEQMLLSNLPQYDIHDIEKNFNFAPDIVEIAHLTLEAIQEYCDDSLEDLIPEKTVYSPLGYGGMIDAHNDEFLIDWKTKDGIEEGKKYAYPDHARQLAAYSACLKGPGFLGPKGRRCINVFIDRQVPGAISIKEWRPEEIEKAWGEFYLCLKLWQSMNNYIPGESNG